MHDTPSDNPVADLVARCIVALEAEGAEDGPAAVEAILATDPERAAAAREQLNVLVEAGLLEVSRAVQQQIGPYRIIRPLGRGGMGMVYLAEQRAPVRRQVAVKVLHKELCREETLARFDQERNALALVAHPNICTVFDAGATAEGQPWIAMEYVRGAAITEYCTRRHLSLHDTLTLFIQVCDAVQHAHQRGVLHRDLKPTNIMVADRDSRPFPVVIDFGVAKSTRGNLGERTLHTQVGQVLGTPGYMSPEQALNEDDVDTRTDIYSLGTVLFELLTGRPPADGESRPGSTPDRTKPRNTHNLVTPSAAVAAGADTRFSERTLRHDLDWIVGKATETDPNRRYPMPAALADDLRRYLRKDPVEARAPGALYRLRKVIQRHRTATVATVLVFLAMGIATATSLVFSKRAQDSAAQSERNRTRTADAIDRMLAELATEQLAWVPEIGPMRRRLMRDAEELYAEMLTEPTSSDAAGQFARARTLVNLGRIKLLLSNSDRSAVPPLAEADAIYARLSAAADSEVVADRVLCAYWNAMAGRAKLDSEQVASQHRAVLRFAQDVSQLPAKHQRLVAESALHLAHNNEALFSQAVGIYDNLAAANPYFGFDAAAAVGRYAIWLLGRNRRDESTAQETEFLARLERVQAKFSQRPSTGLRLQAAQAEAETIAGLIMTRTDRELDGIERLRPARANHMELLAGDPDPNQRIDVICDIDRSTCSALVVYGRIDEARKQMDNNIAWLRERLVDTEQTPRVAAALGRSLQNRAFIEVNYAEFRGALDTPLCDALLAEGEQLFTQLREEYPDWTIPRLGLADAMMTRANTYTISNDPRKLEACRQATEALASTMSDPPSPNDIAGLASMRRRYAEALAQAEDWPRARAVLQASLAQLRPLFSGATTPSGTTTLGADTANLLAEICLRQHDFPAARDALAVIGTEMPLSSVFRITTATLWMQCGSPADLDQAQRQLRVVREVYREDFGSDSEHAVGLGAAVIAGRIHTLAAALAAARGRPGEAAREALIAVQSTATALTLRPSRSPEPLIAALAAYFSAIAAQGDSRGNESATGVDWEPLRSALDASTEAARQVRSDPRLRAAREQRAFAAVLGG